MTTATMTREALAQSHNLDVILPITRVDMSVKRNGVLVSQYEDGWTAGTFTRDVHLNITTPLPDMLAWFVARGWQVVEWGYGARAWKGPRLPVRSRWQIKTLRRELVTEILIYPSSHNYQLHPLAGKLDSLNLAYYL